MRNSWKTEYRARSFLPVGGKCDSFHNMGDNFSCLSQGFSFTLAEIQLCRLCFHSQLHMPSKKRISFITIIIITFFFLFSNYAL